MSDPDPIPAGADPVWQPVWITPVNREHGVFGYRIQGYLGVYYVMDTP